MTGFRGTISSVCWNSESESRQWRVWSHAPTPSASRTAPAAPAANASARGRRGRSAETRSAAPQAIATKRPIDGT